MSWSIIMIWMLSRYEYHFSDHKRSDRILGKWTRTDWTSEGLTVCWLRHWGKESKEKQSKSVIEGSDFSIYYQTYGGKAHTKIKQLSSTLGERNQEVAVPNTCQALYMCGFVFSSQPQAASVLAHVTDGNLRLREFKSLDQTAIQWQFY